jgi:hypothetical protein
VQFVGELARLRGPAEDEDVEIEVLVVGRKGHVVGAAGVPGGGYRRSSRHRRIAAASEELSPGDVINRAA